MSRQNTLRQRVIRAGSWSLAGHVVTQGLRLGGNLILTRLLTPEMFGVMAVVYVLMIGLTLFSDVGIGQSIVQSQKGEDPRFLNTAWAMQIMRGVLIWLLALCLSLGLWFAGGQGWLGHETVYANPVLPLVVAAFSFTAVIQGFESTKLALAKRNLQLNKVIQIEIASQALALFVMVLWATVVHSIWSLVAGGLVAGVSRAALSHYVLHGPANRWLWNAEAVKEILGFGKWVFLSSIIGFLAINGDRLILGGLVDAKLLGLYAIAFLIVNSMQVALTQLMGNVALPALSEVVRASPERLSATYYKLRLPLDAALLLLSGLLFAVGPLLIGLLYDERYAYAGDIVRTLALGGIAVRYQIVDQCYLALGKPKMLMVTSAARLVALYVMVPLGFMLYGFDGAVWCIVLHPLVVLPIIFYFKWQHGLLNLRKELIILPLFALGAAIGQAMVWVWGI